MMEDRKDNYQRVISNEHNKKNKKGIQHISGRVGCRQGPNTALTDRNESMQRMQIGGRYGGNVQMISIECSYFLSETRTVVI